MPLYVFIHMHAYMQTYILPSHIPITYMHTFSLWQTHITYKNGLQLLHFPDNQMEKHYPDGSRYAMYTYVCLCIHMYICV